MTPSGAESPGLRTAGAGSEPGPTAALLRNSAIAYLLVNLPFLFFFYDAFNLNDTLYSTSFLFLGLTPYDPAHSATILVGYPMQPYNLGMLGAYEVDGFNVLATAIVLKLLALAATYLAARLLLRIALREKYAYWKAIYLGFLFNPFLLFVNVIWIETDVFIILALLVGYYFLNYGWGRSSDPLSLACGAVALLGASFAYYSPFLLLPAFIVYGHGLRGRLTTALAFGVFGLLMAVPLLYFVLSPFHVVGASGMAGTDPYSLAQLFLPLHATVSVGVARSIVVAVALASVVLPLVLWRLRVHLSVALLTVLAFALLVTPSGVQGDNFVLLTGLIPLALIFTRGLRITWPRILLLELFLLPLMWIVEMWNGPGQVSGVYYWSFFLLHQNVDLYQPLGGTFAWRASLVAVTVLLSATIAFLVWRHRSALGDPRAGRVERPTEKPLPARLPALGPRGRPLAIGVIVAIALLLIAPVGSIATPGGFALRTDGAFPSQLFVVHDYDASANYLLASPTTYSVNPSAGDLTIASEAPSMVFVRALHDQAFDVGVRATLLNPASLGVGYPVGVVGASGVDVEFSSELALPSGVPPLAPTMSQGFTPVLERNDILPGVTLANETNGSGIAVYSLPGASLGGTTLAFAGEMAASARSQNILWTFSTNGSIGVEAFLVGQTFYLQRFVHGAWTGQSAGVAVSPGAWFYGGISFGAANDSITAWINGIALTSSGAWTPATTSLLNLGKYSSNPADDGVYAFIGDLTGLFALPTSSLRYTTDAFVADPPSVSPLMEVNGSTVAVEYSGGTPQAELTVNGQPMVVVSSDPSVQVGKIGDSPIALEFNFGHVWFSSTRPTGGAFWLVVEFAAALPATPFVLLGARYLQGRTGAARTGRSGSAPATAAESDGRGS
jgi:hypothetical protein